MSYAGCKPSPDGLVFECGHNSGQRLVGNAVSDAGRGEDQCEDVAPLPVCTEQIA